MTGKSSWPSLKTLFLLRLWSMIFPCSDFRHVVMTPAILLMCEYLMRCPIMSGQDITIGSFLCSMMLSISRQSQKFCPEAIMFIQTLLIAAFDKKKSGPSEDSKLYRLMEIKALRPLLCLQGHVGEINTLDFLMLMDLPDDSPYFTTDVLFIGSIYSEFNADGRYLVRGSFQNYVIYWEISGEASNELLKECCNCLDRSFLDAGYIGSRKVKTIGAL